MFPRKQKLAERSVDLMFCFLFLAREMDTEGSRDQKVRQESLCELGAGRGSIAPN